MKKTIVLLFSLLFIQFKSFSQLKYHELIDSNTTDTAGLIKGFIERNQKFGADTTIEGRFFGNNFVFSFIVSYSKATKDQLKGGASFMKVALKSVPQGNVGVCLYAAHSDTYANLNYRLGIIKEALKWENLAVKYCPKEPQFKLTLDRIKRKERIWPPASK